MICSRIEQKGVLTMTSKEVAFHLGERRGCEFKPADCAYLDGWIFWRDKAYNEIEAIEADNSYAECYDARPYTPELWKVLRSGGKDTSGDKYEPGILEHPVEHIFWWPDAHDDPDVKRCVALVENL